MQVTRKLRAGNTRCIIISHSSEPCILPSPTQKSAVQNE